MEEVYCLNCGKELHQSRSSFGKFCDNRCQQDYIHAQWIEDWKAGKNSGVVGEYGTSKHLRKYFFEKYNNCCQLCGWGEENPYTGTIPLELHHVDGDYTNNAESNLQLLCPNCHSLTETTKSHNKTGRKARKRYTK